MGAHAMRKWFWASLILCLPAIAGAADAPPDWAYPATPQGYKPPADNGQAKHVSGSTKAYTKKDIDDFFNPPDWFPNEHPAMPNLVQHGKQPIVHACDQCHLSTGVGHPESGNLAGLPAAYVVEQLGEFRNGNRVSSVAGRSANMITVSKALTDDEVMEGAEVRDPHSGFVAYVPMGSIKAGEALASTGGNGKTLQCSICHGADYKGIGNVPRLAGRSAIYIFRQLNDIQHGMRKGNAVAMMQPVVAKLSQ